MAKMGVRLVGPDDPWDYEHASAGTYITSSVAGGLSVEWWDGTSHAITKDVRVHGTSNTNPDFAGGMLYVLFVIQGDANVYALTIDNVPLDTIGGIGGTWGILGWADDVGVHDWQQY